MFVYDRDGKPTSSLCLSPDFAPRSHKWYYSSNTVEGAEAWEEAINELSDHPGNLPQLQWSEGLAQACYDHVRESGPNGLTGHTGADGESPKDRILKYVDAKKIGENLAFTDAENGYNIILQLLIDDGVYTRDHRANILDPDFTHVGISWGCHTYYTEMCCFAYGKNAKEKKSYFKANVAPQLKTWKPYKPLTKGEECEDFKVGQTRALEALPNMPPLVPDDNKFELKENNQIDNISPTDISKFYDMYPGLKFESFGSESGSNNPSEINNFSYLTEYGDHQESELLMEKLIGGF